MPDQKLFPNETVIITKFFGVHQDWSVPIPGFFIIEPLRKMKSIADLSDEEADEFIDLLRETRKGMKDVLNINEVYLFQNEDSRHGFHLWVFPRHDWMERFGRQIQSVRPIMDYAEENMASDLVISEVKDCVRKMGQYMSGFHVGRAR